MHTVQPAIRSVKKVQPTLPERSWHGGGQWLAHRAGDGRRVFVHKRVIEAIRYHEARHSPNEIAGLLIGRAFQSNGAQYAVVTDLVTHEPGEIDSQPGSVRITPEGSYAMALRAYELDPLADVLGWWHTHPRFRAFYSGVDRSEQAHWSKPIAVGLVFSGMPGDGPEWRVYVGPEAADTDLARELVTPDAPAAPPDAPPAPPDAPAERPAPRLPRDRPRRRRPRSLSALYALGAVAILCAVVWLGRVGQGGEPASTAPQAGGVQAALRAVAARDTALDAQLRRQRRAIAALRLELRATRRELRDLRTRPESTSEAPTTSAP